MKALDSRFFGASVMLMFFPTSLLTLSLSCSSCGIRVKIPERTGTSCYISRTVFCAAVRHGLLVVTPALYAQAIDVCGLHLSEKHIYVLLFYSHAVPTDTTIGRDSAVTALLADAHFCVRPSRFAIVSGDTLTGVSLSDPDGASATF